MIRGILIASFIAVLSTACRGGRTEAGSSAKASASASSSQNAPAASTSNAAAAVASTSAASAAATGAPADPFGETSLDDLEREDSNVEGIGGLKMDGVDGSRAPTLGASPRPVVDAVWSPLPGGALQIAVPRAWTRSDPATDIGSFMSPDQTAFVLYTTFGDREELKRRTEMALRVVKARKVAWRRPREVRLGSDKIAAIAMSGVTEVPSGKARVVLLTMQTGSQRRVLALGIREAKSPVATTAALDSIMLSPRKKRPGS